MKPFNRRNFLKAGGMSLTIPFLESIPQFAHAQANSPNFNRLLFFGLSQAQYENVLMPTGTNYQTGPEGVRYIPLNSINGDISMIFTANKYNHLRSKMNIMRGFDILSSADHVAPGHENLMPFGACGGNTPASSRVRDTIDTVISNSSVFYPTTPYRRLLNAVPVRNEGHRYNYSWQNGDYRSFLNGPTKIFAEFFANGVPGGTTPEDVNRNRRLALESAMGKVLGLSQNSRLSTADRAKLGEHAALMNNLIQTLAPGTGGGAVTGCSVPANPAGIDESFHSASGNQARLRSCLDQIFMAFFCQLTSVATFHPVVAYDTGNWEMGDGGNDVYHQMAGHHYELEKYLKYNGWVYDQLLYLLNKMDSVTEANGRTMLDNSLVVVVSNDACGVHSHRDMPVVTFGTLGGKLKAGNYINYQRLNAPEREGGSLALNPAPNSRGEWGYYYKYRLGRPLGSLYNTILNVLGIPHSGFGAYVDPSGHYSEFTTAAAKQKSLPILT